MTEFTRTQAGNTATYQSDVVGKADTITLGPRLISASPHCFLGVEMFADAAGTTPATATAGTFTVAVLSTASPQKTEAPVGAAISAASLTQVDWQTNTDTVTVTPAGITGDALYWRVTITTNRS